MKLKFSALAAAAALTMLGSAAQAQWMQPPPNPLYGEIGYSFMKVHAQGTDIRPDALRFILGYDFHPYFAVEGLLGWGISNDSQNNIGGVPVNFTGKVDNVYGLYLKPKYNWNQVEIFGRLGWAQAKVHATFNGADVSETDSDFSWGAGLNYHFNPQMYVGLDWMRYTQQSGSKVEGLNLGFGYRF